MVRRAAVVAGVAAEALAAPSAAFAHATLLQTFPAASTVVRIPPREVRLVFDEEVEPRFATISVTDSAARSQVDGVVQRSPSSPYEVDVPLRRAPEGWYLVVWRVVSADGHAERGAFTYRIGPRPGPPPRFTVPSLTETAVTPGLIALRWLTFVSFMSAVGLFVLRTVIARPMVDGLRGVTRAFAAAIAVSLVAAPLYDLLATAHFALRSFWSFGALIPLVGASRFGRSYLRLELALALLAVAGGIAIRLDRPGGPRRSAAALASLWGGLLAAAAVLLVPGTAGHAAQTAPRWAALLLDWSHLASGSVWLGGLVGLLVLGRRVPGAVLVVGVRRFSAAALVSVAVLIGSGTGASALHLPTLAALWQTGYGTVIIAKAAIMLAALLAASINRRRTTPALRPIAVEAVVVASAVVAAAVLSSLPPPPRALASLGAVSASVGPGPVAEAVTRGGYRLVVRVSPNRVGVPDEVAVRLVHGRTPVRGAGVLATFTMLDMEMPAQTYRLAEHAPGVYARSTGALAMVGRWGLAFHVTPPGAQPFDLALVDHAGG